MAECPACKKPMPETLAHGTYCASCLEKTMDAMTPEDWGRELRAVFDRILAKPTDT